MTAGPIDTPPVLAQCQKCSAYVFQANVSGCTILVDPAAIQGPELTLKALGEGKALYSRHGQHLKPSKNPLTGDHLAAHGCTVAGTVRASRVEVAPESPQQAPAWLGRPQGGLHPLPVLVGAQTAAQGFSSETSSPPSPAPHANLRLSKPTRCDICNKLIQPGESDTTALEYDGRMVWAIHERC